MITQELTEKLNRLYKQFRKVNDKIIDLSWEREDIQNETRRIEHLLKK